jgi:5-methylcytosine-specific restriction endonuclease McrA
MFRNEEEKQRYIKSRKHKANLGADLWYIVLERDNWTCQYCGVKANPKDYDRLRYRGVDTIQYEGGVVLNVDHIIPRSKGGKNTLDNLKTACFACNQNKKHKKLEDWQSHVHKSGCVKPELVVVQ